MQSDELLACMNKINKKRLRKRRWVEVDDAKFVQVWANKYAELRGPKKNVTVYAEMVTELSVLGVDVTVEEVRNKILNLTKKYRHHKQDYDPQYPFVWPLYSAVHDIIGAEPVKKREVVSNDNFESDPLKLAAIQLTPVKYEPTSSPSLLESPKTSPPPSPPQSPPPSPAPKVFQCPSPAVVATSTSLDQPAEQAIDTLLTVCNRLSENVERHLMQSLVVEKQKLQELRAIRLATTKMSNGILEFLRSSSSNLNNK